MPQQAHVPLPLPMQSLKPQLNPCKTPTHVLSPRLEVMTLSYATHNHTN